MLLTLAGRSAFGQMLSLQVEVVGAPGRTFQVHRGLLLFYSGHSNSLFGPVHQTVSDRYLIYGQNPAVFERFLFWLYTGKIEDGTRQTDTKIIIELWCFAVQANVPLLMNEMVDRLQRWICDNRKLPLS